MTMFSPNSIKKNKNQTVGYLQDSVNSISDVGSVDEPGLNAAMATKRDG